MVGNVQAEENEEERDGTYVDGIGQTQRYPRINMVKIINTMRKQENGV